MRCAKKWLVLIAVTIGFQCGAEVANAADTEVMETDIVVVGGGLSGLSAGLTAVENGAKAVVFEKLPGVGGAGNFPEGSLGVGTRYQKSRGSYKTADEVFAKGIEFHHWRINASALRTLINESGKTIDWVEDHGITFRGIRTMYPPEKSLGTWHLYKGGAANVVKTFYKAFLAKGGAIYTETTVKSLLTDNQGKVTGVVALRSWDGKTFVVKARGGVILATGGFESNKEMLKKYVSDINAEGMLERVMYRGPLIDGRTGDGIQMAEKLGAKLEGMGTLAGNSPYLDDEPPIYQFNGPDHLKQMRCALSQPFLWVNKAGNRFYNESAGASFTDVYNAMTANGGLMYSIFDESMKERLVNEGPYTPFNAIVVVGQKMKALNEGLEVGFKKGYAFKANTIEELAEKIQVDPEALKATIAKVNSYAAQKKDPDFNRKPEHLFTFKSTGPYYALKGIRAFFLTLGGVKINDHMQAIHKDGKPIPNLYVSGQDIGGLYDSTYDLLLEGSASSFALTSGRLAAEHIIKTKLTK